MATLSLSQIQMYAAAAGLPNPPLMAAIGMAESSGRTDVVNSIGCVGIWQINQPVHVKRHPTWTKAWLKNPANNAKAAKVIYESQGLKAWEAYTNGAYKRYYKGGGATQAEWWKPGESPLNPLDPPGEMDFSVDQLVNMDAWNSVVTAIGKAGNWISNPRNWLRIGYVGAGAVLVGIGAGMVAREVPAVQKLNSSAKQLVGAAVKARTGRAEMARQRASRTGEAYDKVRVRHQARKDNRRQDEAEKRQGR